MGGQFIVHCSATYIHVSRCMLRMCSTPVYMTGPSMQIVHCGMVPILHCLQGAKNVHQTVMWTSKANCVSSPSPLGLPVFA